ncbi:immunity 42 family protein [Snodgrassella gandavensis]|uniref:immunity 42 family protein n=1 Tax=Snodgrassella gandavensis TaxID=2946698 RepID=UPI001EF60C1A|nr:immunity 42 family protein [Snodgrassella gandavensis]
MIYGDPFYFALHFDVVPYWNDEEGFWQNGLFYFYIDGKRVFELVDIFELKTIFSFYKNIDISQLSMVDENIHYADLYKNAENYFTGDSEKLIDGLFDLTCTPMGDNGCYVYFCKTLENDKFIWSIDDGKTINQSLLPPRLVESVIKLLRDI